MAGGDEGPPFESTPSWIIGAVIFLIVSISLVVEKLLSYLGQVLERKEKKALYEALQKIKEELMLLGFISLVLAVFQTEIAKWCIPEKLAQKWLPCHNDGHTNNSTSHFQTNSGRRLLAEVRATSCPEGKVPFISFGALHYLHLFIFVLAVVHVLACSITVLLGEAKISQWRKWEETIRLKNLGTDDNQRVIHIRNLSFIKQRFEGVDAHKRNYVISFFKHLLGLVTKADYEAMRLGFILTHCNGDKKFNFHKYIVYAYEADFEKVVSISWLLWLFVVILFSLNLAGWHIFFWASIIPIILLFVVGTMLQQVITELAIYVAQRHTIMVGDIKIQPSDEYFWFNKPRIMLLFIHIILFLNSFGFAIFFWSLSEFGFESCVMGKQPGYIYPRIAILVAVQTICSYSTLPLYAIVTQMGSSYNKEAMERSSYHGVIHGVAQGPSSHTTASVEMASP